MDGGYYAIKGFEFQIDKTILEILDTEDDVSLENIQDINTDSIVIQVKYKETQEYSDNKVREPVLQLIEEFKKDRLKKYKLFSYFSDKSECDETINRARLDSILTLSKGNSKEAKKINERINSIDNNDKNDFLKVFSISYSKNYQEQFSQVLNKIKYDIFIGSSDDEAIFYYSNATNYLRKIVINTTDTKLRVCSKNKLINHLTNGKKLIFDSSFRQYKGDGEYFKFVKKRHFTFSNIDDFERFFIIEAIGSENLSDIKEVVFKIKDKFYKKFKTCIKSGAPYIFLRNFDEKFLLQLKTELLADGFIFKDGHDFYNAEFFSKTLREYSTIENNICLKFINKFDNLEKIVAENLGKTKQLYQFFITDPIEVTSDIKHVKIKINNLSEIYYII